MQHTPNLWKQKESNKINIKEEEVDRDNMHKILVTEFNEQTRRKEQTEGGKNGGKTQWRWCVRKDKNSKQPMEDFAPWQHSSLKNHYQNHIRFSIYNEWTRTILQHLM